MNKTMITSGVLAGLILASAAVGTVAAQSSKEPVAVTMTQAIEAALAEAAGEVQETELEREDGKQVYEIEILTEDGREVEVEIDATTGEVLEVEVDDDDDEDDDDEA